MIEPIKNILYIARRFKLATAFNLLGLIVAFAAFYLMMTQVIFQTTYNRDIEDCERLYRLDTDFLNNNGLFSDKIFYPIVNVLDSLPEVESYSLMYRNNDDPVFASFYEQPFQTKEGDTLKFKCENLCNNTAVSTLTSKVLSGRIHWIAGDSVSPGVIIPASIATQYFGSTDVAGEKMTAIFPDGLFQWSIRGVYEDFPRNSELSNCIYQIMHEDEKDAYRYYLGPSLRCFIKFRQVLDDVEVLNNDLKQAILDMLEEGGWEEYADNAGMSTSLLKQAISDMHIRLTPLKDSFFETKSLNSSDHGFKPMVIILSLACLLLILIAAIHFLNYVLVESPTRIRGINTRLVLGASRRSLQLGIIAECVITSVIACAIALILCSSLSSWEVVRQLIDGKLAVWNHPRLALCTLFTAGIVGIAAGSYPSIFVTSFVPAMALKGNYGLSPQGHKLRKAILALQLFISFLMVIYLGILIQEERFIFHSEYGFNKNQILITSVPLGANDSTKQELYNELTELHGVKNVSFSDGSMGLSDFHGSQLIEIHGTNVSFNYSYVDTAYLNTMGLEVTEGRSFLPTDTATVIINKSAQRKWNWMKVGAKIPSESRDDSLTIVGICDGVRYNTTRLSSDQPFAFIIEPESNRYYLNISINEDVGLQTLDEANAILRKHFDREARPLISFNQKLEESYESEFRFFRWIFILSIVCTIITLIGVFCLMMFESEYRRKEIGIRKISGAKTHEIVGMLCRQYIPLILISFAVAAPIAMLSGRLTFSHFAEHVPLSNTWWILPLALVVVGGIVMTTILLQSWRTARENPAGSIKTE